MSIQSEYLKSQSKYYINCVSNRVLKRRLYCEDILGECISPADGNNAIYNAIMSGKQFCAIRGGGTEMKTIADVLYTREKGGHSLLGERKITLDRIRELSGFFPSTFEGIEKFTDLYLNAMSQADLLGVWNVIMQDYIARTYSPNSVKISISSLEPYYFENPWSEALAGKKVLVIHPFAETIESQYQKREFLFENPKVLPEFELHTLKAVQSLGGYNEDFASWFDALDWMKDQMNHINFDVALVGCGAYGLPLAAYAKEIGKQAIQVSGALQLLFGIKGKRWDNNPGISKFYNEYWVRPGQTDQPKNKDKVESGCYW